MSKIKIGVFGAARGMTMIHQTLNHPEAELVAICDKYRPLLDECKKLSDEHGLNLQLFEDFEDFFKVDMDAVVLANYANEHAPYAIRLLDSGRHVMSEVLTCQTMKEAVELIEAVERSGKIYAYAENYCYFNTTAEMRRRYKNGDIGDLTHAEGEYVHDCSSIWPQITYGERDHWRNLMHSTFYCTHSLGPILFSTGLRPVSVVGFQSSNFKCMKDLGALYGTSAIELVTLENGATVKSMHGGLKRSPDSINYQMFGTKGCMET
ncbi:MAG: Gfo/Idh/MocA family oxidoreductase, partial [Clostridia bacterium]|nr:Gfo/Idh/MocA family oxidoreductase [Clostridia bacterium]